MRLGSEQTIRDSPVGRWGRCGGRGGRGVTDHVLREQRARVAGIR